MTDVDYQMISYIVDNGIVTINELSENFVFRESYVRTRLELLEKYNLCYHSGDGKYRSHLDREQIVEKEDRIRNIGYRTVKYEPETPIEWFDREDVANLDHLQNYEPAAIWEMDGVTTSLEEASKFSKYSDAGLVTQTTPSKYVLTSHGLDVSENEITPYQAIRPLISKFRLPIHMVAQAILSILGRFDSSSENTVRNIDASAWQAERIFHNIFPVKSPIYLILSICGVMAVYASYQGIVPIGFQALGLGFDVVGAIFVALGLFRGRKGIAIDSEELAGRFASEIPLQNESVKTTTASTLDGVFGTIFLISGFILQLIAVVTN
jgi:hypothetical protein